MSSTKSPSSFLDFIDSFLREKSIRWLLGTGVLILLGSSMMLVTSHWETSTALWKCVVLLSYTAVVHAAGSVSLFRLGLARTGSVLLGLTVVLLPVVFLALHWVGDGAGDAGVAAQPLAALAPDVGWTDRLLWGSLLVALGAFAVFASQRVFRYFLRETQPTFLASYLTLCLAGTLAPLVPEAWAPGALLFLWAVFTAGVVKVNRHVFWLTEEHRKPRVFGFLPIGLLGGQFLALVLTHFSSCFSNPATQQWMGLGLVLVSVTVLLTADAVARVHRQRSGVANRPFPPSIALPFAVGLFASVAGLLLAASALGVDASRAYALSPTALLFAVVIAIVARRTEHRAFTWAALFGVTAAYDFSPVFFRELATRAVQGSADAISEETLPWAFYGLTFLPLLVTATMLAGRARDAAGAVFRMPLRQYAVGLATLLLACAWTHEKALLPVGASLALLFAFQAWYFRDRLPIVLAVGAIVTAAFGVAPFAAINSVGDAGLFGEVTRAVLIATAAMLVAAGRWVDRTARRLPLPGPLARDAEIDRLLAAPCRHASLAITGGLAFCWLLVDAGRDASSASAIHAAAVAALCGVHAVALRSAAIGGVAIGLGWLAGLTHSALHGATMMAIVHGAIVVACAQWCAALVLRRFRNERLTRSIEPAARAFAHWILVVIATTFLPLLIAVESAGLTRAMTPGALDHACRALIVVWLFVAAYRHGSPWLTLVGFAIAVGGVGSALVGGAPERREWLPVAWTTMALLFLPLAARLDAYLATPLEADAARTRKLARIRRRSRLRAIADPLGLVVTVALIAASFASLFFVTWPMRITGGIGLAGLVAASFAFRQSGLRSASWIAVNWHALWIAVQLVTPEVRTVFDLARAATIDSALPLAALTVASLALSHLWPRRGARTAPIAVFLHQLALGGLGAICLARSTVLGGLDATSGALAAFAFVGLAVNLLVVACRQRSTAVVWLAECVLGLGVAYFAHFGWITFGRGRSLWAILGASLAFRILAAIAARRPELRTLVRPFRQTALLLPGATVLVALVKHVGGFSIAWRGANSLAILLAAAIWFWRGIESRQRRWLVGALAIADVAFVVLWRELAAGGLAIFGDPQFYMVPIGASVLVLVQLLRHDLPQRWVDPLRYVGALIVLVSPVFHIVGGSWWHILSLMVIAVATTLLGIGLRLRAFLYAGTAFLVADVIAMIVHGSIENPDLLWIAGVGLGGAVIALGAYCERRRDVVVDRLRGVAAALETWK